MSGAGSFLAKISAAKRAEMAVVAPTERERVRHAALVRRAAVPAHRLRKSLAAAPLGIIAEVKRSSPSAGAIRADADPIAIAGAYARHGAVGISVLTEPKYFSGSLEDLRAVCATVASTGCPVLRKDFIVDAHQLYEAAAAGASAALLIVAALSDSELSSLRAVAEDELGLDALVEVHDEVDMRGALACGATLIGINNRNLATLTVDLATSRALAHYAQPGRLLISESGLRTAADLRELNALGYQGFLIGETLMRAADPGLELERLLAEARPTQAMAFATGTPQAGAPRPAPSSGADVGILSSARKITDATVAVKVCGITNPEDARLASELGAAMLGFNFYPRSPRYLAPAEAAPLIAALPQSVEAVGLFVNAGLDEVARAVAVSGVRAVQLHGNEPPEFALQLRRRLPGVRLIKAFGTGEEFSPARAADYPADAILLDAACEGFGGSGLRADWKVARKTVEVLNAKRTGLILAGGLNAENVAEAIATVQPAAVDVCSGVESAKGRKDPHKLRVFFAAVGHATALATAAELGSRE